VATKATTYPPNLGDQLLLLDDGQLIARVFELAGEIIDRADGEGDDFYWILEELSERFAPAAAWQEAVRARRAREDTPAEVERELHDARRHFVERATSRAKARCF
jgi:hypothetical protein